VADARAKIAILILCFLGRITLKNENELGAWRLATAVLVLLAVLMFIIQHFVVRFFDVALEISAFYIPAVSVVILFLYFSRRTKPDVKP
jgi:hypothetical protein